MHSLIFESFKVYSLLELGDIAYFKDTHSPTFCKVEHRDALSTRSVCQITACILNTCDAFCILFSLFVFLKPLKICTQQINQDACYSLDAKTSNEKTSSPFLNQIQLLRTAVSIHSYNTCLKSCLNTNIV